MDKHISSPLAIWLIEVGQWVNVIYENCLGIIGTGTYGVCSRMEHDASHKIMAVKASLYACKPEFASLITESQGSWNWQVRKRKDASWTQNHHWYSKLWGCRSFLWSYFPRCKLAMLFTLIIRLLGWLLDCDGAYGLFSWQVLPICLQSKAKIAGTHYWFHWCFRCKSSQLFEGSSQHYSSRLVIFIFWCNFIF